MNLLEAPDLVSRALMPIHFYVRKATNLLEPGSMKRAGQKKSKNLKRFLV
jgi:hypothetical protein